MTALSVAPDPAPAPLKPCRMQSASGVTYDLMLVTPDLAEQWLGKNVGNRRVRKAILNRYSRDIAAGRWRENGSSVVRARNGNLLDGQHRLHAIVQTGEPAWLLVVQNVDDVAQPTIDDGAKRTTADRLTFRDEVNSHTTAAVLRRVMMWEAGKAFNSGAYQPTSQEQLEFLDGHGDRLRAAVNAAVYYKKRKLLPPSIIGLCWYVFSGLDADGAQEFFDRLDDGANLAYNHPITVLRNKLIDLTREPGRVPEDTLLHYVVKTWNLYRAKKPAQVLRIGKTEQFPTPR